MRALVVYFGVIGVVIWMASDGQIDRISTRFGLAGLPGSTSAPFELPLDRLPNPQDINSLNIVPAAQAGSLTPAKVVGSVVNLRAGPGLSYRMIDVAERGETILISGEWVENWAPIILPETGQSAWVHGDYISAED
ncbi:MAG: SH3 domain-containing protein [Pikeienuella sp.]